MNRFRHSFLIAMTLALPLAGCDTLPDFSNADPTEWFNVDFLHNKKPLPGERKPLFPGGVPGVTRGVPPELVKGNQPPPETQIARDPTAQQSTPQQIAVEEDAKPEPPPEPKPKARPKPKPKVAAKPAPQFPPPPAAQSAPTQVTVRRSDSPPPEPSQQAQPQPFPAQQPSAAQWPEPPRPAGASPGGVQWPDPPAPSAR